MLVPNLTADHHTCRVTDGCKITDSSRRLQSADLSMATVSAGARYHKASMMRWHCLANKHADHHIGAAPRFVVFHPTQGAPSRPRRDGT